MLEEEDNEFPLTDDDIRVAVRRWLDTPHGGNASRSQTRCRRAGLGRTMNPCRIRSST
jgi:hypothetical protein